VAAKWYENTTLLLGVAGVGLTAIALMVTKSKSSGSTSSSSGGVSSADLTSQVNNVNANAASVTKALLAAQTSVENTALAGQTQTGANANSGLVSVENNTLSTGAQYAMYDSGQRSNVVSNTMLLGDHELSTIEAGLTSRLATATNATAHEYDSQLNALTTQYGERAAVFGAELAKYPTEFGTVGAQTSSEIGSEAQQASNEAQAQASASNGFWNALASITKSAAGAFSGGLSQPTSGSSSAGAGVAAPNAGSFGTWGSTATGGSSSVPGMGTSDTTDTGAAAAGGFLSGYFGPSDPADEPGWKFTPAPTPQQPTLSGGNTRRYVA
jgi:hypothetical protein